MSDDIINWMTEMNVRGWLIVAESKFIGNYCEKIGMARVESPVYVKVGMEKT
jgi:hypothetical protein